MLKKHLERPIKSSSKHRNRHFESGFILPSSVEQSDNLLFTKWFDHRPSFEK
jgi:hypothetical protein